MSVEESLLLLIFASTPDMQYASNFDFESRRRDPYHYCSRSNVLCSYCTIYFFAQQLAGAARFCYDYVFIIIRCTIFVCWVVQFEDEVADSLSLCRIFADEVLLFC